MSTLRLMVMRHRQILAGDLRLGADGRLRRQVVARRLLHQRPHDRAGFGRALGNVGALLVEDRLLADRDSAVAAAAVGAGAGAVGATTVVRLPRRWQARPGRSLPALRDRSPAAVSQHRRRARPVPALSRRSRPVRPPVPLDRPLVRQGRPLQARPGRRPRVRPGRHRCAVDRRRRPGRHRGDRRAFAKRSDAAGRSVVDLRAVAVQPLREFLGTLARGIGVVDGLLRRRRRGRIAGGRRVGARSSGLRRCRASPGNRPCSARRHSRRRPSTTSATTAAISGAKLRRRSIRSISGSLSSSSRLAVERHAGPSARSICLDWSSSASGRAARPWLPDLTFEPASTGGVCTGAAVVRLLHRVGKHVLELGERIVVGARHTEPSTCRDRVFEHTLLPLGHGRRRRRADRGELGGDGGAGLFDRPFRASPACFRRARRSSFSKQRQNLPCFC